VRSCLAALTRNREPRVACLIDASIPALAKSCEHALETNSKTNSAALRSHAGRVIAISLVVLLPCFWHRRIEAGDLGSHTYNAWLAQLIGRGQAPGLYIARQWTNVLGDLLLAHLGRLLGLPTAERIVVSLSVLIFFWGAFALIHAASMRSPWLLTPAIAMLAYGWTFQMGFLNYYLSLGLAFFAVALFWRADGVRGWICGLLLSVFSLVAHPIGFLWLAGTSVYVIIAKRGWARWMLFPLALFASASVHFYVRGRYVTSDPILRHFYLFIGPDQLVVFGHRYRLVALGFLLMCGCIVAAGVAGDVHRAEFWRTLRTPLELGVLAVFTTAMFWGGISVSGYSMSLGFLPQRVSLISAVLLLCSLGCMLPHRWHLIALSLCAAIFFLFLYQDTGTINRMEENAENQLGTLPRGSRVIATIWPPPGWRVGVEHIFDRACINHCFAYSNYEPSTKQFRIRVNSGSPVVVASAAAGLAMREGRYVVKAEDLPLKQFCQCNPEDLTQFCLRDLTAGEVNSRLGYQPVY
jgi:hypothetical protein